MKYLPDITLGYNVVAVPDIVETVKDATAIIFVMPHQCESRRRSRRRRLPHEIRGQLTLVLDKVLDDISGHISPNAKAISLIKGVDVKGADIHIFADVIEKRLGIPCSALSGANIASEVALGRFSETTIGYRNEADGVMWQKVFRECPRAGGRRPKAVCPKPQAAGN